jgi:formylmethanofuran dehydrogenase subunit B
MTQELVEAFDVDEALVTAYGRRPELPRPRTAYLVRIDVLHFDQ